MVDVDVTYILPGKKDGEILVTLINEGYSRFGITFLTGMCERGKQQDL